MSTHFKSLKMFPYPSTTLHAATGAAKLDDLAAAKLSAGREKSLDFVQVMLRQTMLRPATLAERVATLPLPPGHLNLVRARLQF